MGIKVTKPQIVPEKVYRNDEADSYSTVKDFIKDRKKYYRKYILGEYIEEKDSDSIVTGTLVDKMIQPDVNIDDHIQVAITDKPTGQMLLFVDEMYKIHQSCLDMHGEPTRTMQSIMEEAFNYVKYDRNGAEVAFKKKDFSYVVEKFADSNSESYFNQLVLSNKKTIINLSDRVNAENIVQGLKTSFNTKKIINQQTEGHIEVFYQLTIFFEIEGHPFKGMLDKVIIDHKRKVIDIYDLKTTWSVEGFNETFRKFKYYIQCASYNLAIQHFKKDYGLEDYTTNNLSFIVCDSINYMNPLIYTTTKRHHDQGLYGYIDSFKVFHPGLIPTLENIAWHKETGIWNISKENYESKGLVEVKELI